MLKTDSSMYNNCLEEDIRILRDIEFLKMAVVYKYNKQGEPMDRWVAINLEEIPDVIRGLKYDSTPAWCVSGTPFNEDGSFPTSFYWEAPHGPGPYSELDIRVTPSFSFDTKYMRFNNGNVTFGDNTFYVRTLAGNYTVLGKTVMLPMYYQRENLEYWDISQGYSSGNPKYKVIKPVTSTQTLTLPGLFRGFKVRLYDRPASEYSSLGCYIQEIVIPRYITDLGTYCFYSAYSLTRATIEASLRSLPDYCFSYCTNLNYVNIPNSVITIGESCFAHSTRLFYHDHLSLDVTSLTTIGNRAFEYCTMRELTLGPHVSSIGIDAFAMCNSLEKITMKCSTPPTLQTDNTGNAAAFYRVKTNGTLIIPNNANASSWINWCSVDAGPYSHLIEYGWTIYRENGEQVYPVPPQP
jgi:hypothetical protein